MWHTSAGDRMLAGAEARLFKSALTRMVEDIKEEAMDDGLVEQWEYGIPRFDELTWTQRIQVLEQVASHVLLPSEETPELNAVNESAIAAIYQRMRNEIDFEIDSESESTEWRAMVLEAYGERFAGDHNDEPDDDEEPFELPAPASIDRDAWSDLIGSLEDEILWDQDFLMDEFLDAPPDKAEMLKEYMGIQDDYYSTPAPDVADKSVGELVTRLEKLVE
jgi:hypothetical protein